MQPDRQWSLGSYRYGFNGKENDNEIKGEGNQQDYGMRVYDSRLGKFLSVDPLTKSYPELTPYQFAGNTPIQATDLDGAETFIQRQGNAIRRYAEIGVAKEEQVRRQSEKWRYPEPQILLSDIYGNGHMGPESIVRQNVAAIKNEHDDAVGAAITGGPFGAAGYLIGGDKGAFIGSGVDGVAMSFGGIPAGKSSVFPNNATARVGRVETEPYERLRSVPQYRGFSITLNQPTLGEPVPGRVESRINISNDGWAHVVDRHFYGKRNASQFSISENALRNILASPEVVKSPIIGTLSAKENGKDVTRFVRQLEFSGHIGFDKMSGWKPTSTMTIMTNHYGNLISTTPGTVKKNG